MPNIFVHRDAEEDITELSKSNPRAAARILAFLQQVKADEDLLDRMTQHDYGCHPDYADFHVSKWFEQWNQGKNLWRVKIWDLESLSRKDKYRIIYAFLPRTQDYCVLAIAPREFDYDAEHPISKRVLKAYEDL